MNLTELKKKSADELTRLSQELKLENMGRSRKQDIIFAILKAHAHGGNDIYGDGCIRNLRWFWFLRSEGSYLADQTIFMFHPVKSAANLARATPFRENSPPKKANVILLRSRPH